MSIDFVKWINDNYSKKIKSDYKQLEISDKIPFGKYKGDSISHIFEDDLGYIRFLIEDIDTVVLSYDVCELAFKHGAQNYPHDYSANMELRNFRKEIQYEVFLEEQEVRAEVEDMRQEALMYEAEMNEMDF